MNKEFDAFLANGTWILVPPTPSMNIVGLKWVFMGVLNVTKRS